MIQVGCHVDRASDRDLTGYKFSNSTSMTIELCLDTCRSRNFAYAGLRNGNRCCCDNDYGKHGRAASTDCQEQCTGNAAQTCGGNSRNMVYLLGKSD